MILVYRDGNNLALRQVAFDCVMACQPSTFALMPYLTSVIRHDTSLSIRRHVARLLSQSWITRLSLGEYQGLHEPKMTIVDSGTTVVAADVEKEARADIAAMRQSIHASGQLKAALSVLLA